MRVENADPATLVFIDGGTTRDDAALASLRKSKANIVLKTNSGATSAQAALKTPISSSAVVAALPQDAAGVAAMYRPETAKYPAVLAEYQSAIQRFTKLPNTTILTTRTAGRSIRQQLLAEASAAQKRSLLIVVGHNENGVLKLPDASRVTLDELAQASANSGRPILVLSCDTINTNVATAGFVTTRPLYFDEIATALQRVAVSKPNEQSVGDFVRSVNVALASPSGQANKKQILTAVAVVGGSVLVMVALNGLACRPSLKEKCA